MQAQYFKSNQEYFKKVDSQITTTNLSVNAEDNTQGFYTSVQGHICNYSFIIPSELLHISKECVLKSIQKGGYSCKICIIR